MVRYRKLGLLSGIIEDGSGNWAMKCRWQEAHEKLHKPHGCRSTNSPNQSLQELLLPIGKLHLSKTSTTYGPQATTSPSQEEVLCNLISGMISSIHFTAFTLWTSGLSTVFTILSGSACTCSTPLLLDWMPLSFSIFPGNSSYKWRSRCLSSEQTSCPLRLSHGALESTNASGFVQIAQRMK